MKGIKSIKRTMLLSLLSLILLVSMFVGSTFAWFTDQVTSTGNIIKSGRLAIDMQWSTQYNGVDTEWFDAAGSTAKPIFDYDNWEPGYTEVRYIKVSNEGTLAFKYMMSVLPRGEVGKLAEVITVQYDIVTDNADFVPPTAQNRNGSTQSVGSLQDVISDGITFGGGVLLPEGETKDGFYSDEIIVCVTLHMEESADNRYQGESIGDSFDIRLYAVQCNYENDSFDNSYDANVPGIVKVDTSLNFNEAVSNGTARIVLLNDVDNVNALLSETEYVEIDLNNYRLTSLPDGRAIENRGSLTVKNGTIESDTSTIYNYGELRLDTVELNATDTNYGVHLNLGSETIMDNVTLNGLRGGLNIQYGKAVFNSGTVTVRGYSNKVGHVIYVGGEGAELVINGGEFKFNQGYTKAGVIYADLGAKVVVNDGIFWKGGTGYKNKWIQALNGATVEIYGGRFEFDPSGFVADGYEAVKGSDGWWTVSKIMG
ncbi:MAG: SipW-dependent-type signal peptide-containing protein [Clostridia bacterium]|nr:SipW-dependent-type signal peptide-containing protein [Clostridia bacterium]